MQLSALSTQNIIQNQLAAVTQSNLPKSNLNLTNVTGGSGVSSGDLHTLQLALQQQQQSLQQQLQSFLLMQPGTAQASAVLLHSQVQQAVTQATNQLKILQNQREAQQLKQHLASQVVHLPDTPKSIPRSSPLENMAMARIPLMSHNKKSVSDKNSNAVGGGIFSSSPALNALRIGNNRDALKTALLKQQSAKPPSSVSEALSNLTPIPVGLDKVYTTFCFSKPFPGPVPLHRFYTNFTPNLQ